MVKPITSLNLGDKVKFGRYRVENEVAQDIIWQVASLNNHYKDTNNPSIEDHITLITDRIIDLRGFDAREPNNSNSDRQSSGNNRYRDSNLRQWLNKMGHPWYQSTHSADEPPTDGGMNQPTGYDTKDGFLSSFNEMELAAILDTTLTVARNRVTDGGGSENVTDKVFLASNTEVGLSNENNIVEGSLLPIFSNDASRIAYLTQQAFNNTNSGSKPSTVNDAWYWWLRTPDASGSRNVRYVSTSGALFNNGAYFGRNGVRPLCNLESGILVSDVVDADGAYTIIHAVPHIITLDKAININAGNKLERLKFNPKINNEEMNLQSTDVEKLIFKKENIDTDKVNLEIEGKDGKIDNISYIIS